MQGLRTLPVLALTLAACGGTGDLAQPATSQSGSSMGLHAGSPQVISTPVPGLPASCTNTTSEGETFLASQANNSMHLVAVWLAGGNSGTDTGIAAVSQDGGET